MWCKLLLLLLSWSYIYITLHKIQNTSFVPIKGGTGGDNKSHLLGPSSPFTSHNWGQELESLPGQVMEREQALWGKQEATLKENRPDKQGVVAREDATFLSLIAELSSPPGESWENGYFWNCFPSL